MFLENTGILHGHLPAGEIHQPAPKASVLFMKRGLKQAVVGRHVTVRVRECGLKVNSGFTSSDSLRGSLIPVRYSLDKNHEPA